MIPLIRGTESSQIHRDSGEWWQPGAGGNGELALNGYRVSVLQNEKSSGDG